MSCSGIFINVLADRKSGKSFSKNMCNTQLPPAGIFNSVFASRKSDKGFGKGTYNA